MIYFLYFSWAQLDNLATFFGNIFYHSKFYNYSTTLQFTFIKNVQLFYAGYFEGIRGG